MDEDEHQPPPPQRAADPPPNVRRVLSDRPQPPPPPENPRGSVMFGFWLFWILIPVWGMAVAAISEKAGWLSLAAPLLPSLVLALYGKPRTALGMALGYVSILAPALLLLSLCAGFFFR